METEKIKQLLAKWHQRSNDKRLFIGIGGGSASGKTTIANMMTDKLTPLNVLVINQDRFFKPPAEMPQYYSQICQENRPDYNRPNSFYTEKMFAYCREVTGYDVVILEGILALYYPELRELMQLKIYVYADADERIIRRIKRNLARWSFDEITNYYLESVRYRHEEYNAPTQAYADMVIHGGMAYNAEREAMLNELCHQILINRKI